MKIGRDYDEERAETRGGVINHSRDRPPFTWLLSTSHYVMPLNRTADRILSKRILVRKSSIILHLIVSIVVPGVGIMYRNI